MICISATVAVTGEVLSFKTSIFEGIRSAMTQELKGHIFEADGAGGLWVTVTSHSLDQRGLGRS